MAVAQVENERPEVAELTVDELQNEIATLASHIYAGTCRWLELVAELDRRGSWTESGCGSCAEWLAWRCALTSRTAQEHVRVARRLGELPLIHAAFSRGELSYAKVRALTRVAEEETEEELLELARHLTAAQLERAVRAYRRVSALQARRAHELEYVGYGFDEDGMLFFRGRLAPEEGALFLRALEAARDSLWERQWKQERRSAERRQDGSAEPFVPGRRPTNAEALVAMADRSLTCADGARSGGERYQVIVHVDAAALSSDQEGGCALEDGPAIAPETARRLACDSSAVQITEREGEPLSVGRKTRTIPPALRRALRTRDRGCRFPGCDNRRFVDVHHIQHWAKGGETKMENLVLLCRRHHRLVHEGGYSLERLADGEALFRYPWGGPLSTVPRSPPGAWKDLLDENNRSGLEIGSQTCLSGDGDPMDLGLAVDALLQISASASSGASQCHQVTSSSRGFGLNERPTFPDGRPSVSTTSAVKSFSPRISAEPTP